MALEAVVFPQDPSFGYGCKDYLYNLVGATTNYTFPEDETVLLGINSNNNNNNTEQNVHTTTTWDSYSTSVFQNVKDQWEYSHSSPETCTVDQSVTVPFPPPSSSADPTTTRRKRRRTKAAKNKDEIENQRMTHIAVERNRRKQMNDYLAILRSLMPSSYVQRGDQASIIGGAINFVKELEQLLQSMEGQKRSTNKNQTQENVGLNGSPFAEFFTFPQYTTRGSTMGQNQEQKQWSVADIEVTMVDTHANLKILSKKQPGHLMNIVVGLQSLSLTILHLNVTTHHHLVLYSISVKVEDGCQLNTVDEIAAAVNQLLRTMQEVTLK